MKNECDKFGCRKEGTILAKYKRNYPDKAFRGVEVIVCTKHFDEKIFNEVVSEYNKVIDALNIIDAQANGEFETNDHYREERARQKAYEIVANFINKKAKH